MASVDLKKTYREHYHATCSPTLVSVPDRWYLMVDGEGDPNTAPAYQEAVAALYPIAYGLRNVIKKASGVAYTVMPLEGLWWVEEGEEFSFEARSNWRWTSMICQPEVVIPEMADDVIPAVTAKKQLASGHLVRLERFGDSEAAQILHLGPFADEPATIAELHDFIVAGGHRFRGRHHEIYLSDPRKGDPARQKTIIRQPVG